MIDVLGPEKRRRRTTQEKIAIVQQSFEPGMTVSLVARQHGVAASQLFLWRKQYQEGSLTAVVGGEVGNRFNLLDVRQNAFMAMDDAFWMAFRTGGKEDQRLFFRLLFYLRQARHQQMSEDPYFVGSGDICF